MTCMASRAGKKADRANLSNVTELSPGSGTFILEVWSGNMSKPNDHAGSGVDQPDPKGLLEKFSDGVKSILSKKPEPAGQTGTDTAVGTHRAAGGLIAWRVTAP